MSENFGNNVDEETFYLYDDFLSVLAHQIYSLLIDLTEISCLQKELHTKKEIKFYIINPFFDFNDN